MCLKARRGSGNRAKWKPKASEWREEAIFLLIAPLRTGAARLLSVPIDLAQGLVSHAFISLNFSFHHDFSRDIRAVRLFWHLHTQTSEQGIYVAGFDEKVGATSEPTLAAEAANPTFLATHPTLPVLYAVGGDDKTGGVVLAYAIDPKSGGLTLINQVADGATNGTYISVTPDGRTVLTAHYSGGYLQSFPIRADGSLGECASRVEHTLTGKHPQQSAPHPHCIKVSPDGCFAFAADLAADRIFSYRITPESKLADGKVAAALAEGCGVRHLAFSPDARFMYAINELAATVTVFAYDAATGGLREIETVSTVPPDFSGRRWSAEVAVHRSGKFLYASNRANDESIAAFAVDPASGRLAFLQRTGGLAHPRHFAISPDGGWLLCANQDANNVASFRIDATTGKLAEPAKRFGVPACVCVVFWPAK
ncbi:lactonase family protein [Ereboglobus luteus]|uniref:lactonase family protein n=1 Tax=Ereboglobus luteus TaxID=1796921 RepID=UPI00214F9F35|nr:lactonase family protein [Ereboglobus luteus]